MSIPSGLVATVSATVGSGDTAEALGSGDVPVLGTPRVVALLEAATCAAVEEWLEVGQTTVGLHVELEHLLPARVGAAVTAEAHLAEVDGRRLTFVVRMEDEQGRLVATGRVRRAVVERARFLGGALDDEVGQSESS
jgi:predicted thioesterase